MKQYQIKNSIGTGNFSTVFRVQDSETGDIYAMKIMKTHPKIAAKEAHILKKMKHPNVVQLYDFHQSEDESKMVVEYVGMNTLQLYETHSYGLREEQVKCILFQAAFGLSHVHSFSIIHRDIKPENLLIDKKNAIVKLIDFGLAVQQDRVSTDYIATRWYRAPQNLLGTKEYTCGIDIFSLGCVIVQLYLGSPLFPGANNVDQLYKIFNILGYPSEENWPKGYAQMNKLGIKCGQAQAVDLDIKSILSPCNSGLIDLVQKMLKINPKERISCLEILKHQYFKDIKGIIPPNIYKKFEAQFGTAKAQKISFRGFHNLKSPKVNDTNQHMRNIKNSPPVMNLHLSLRNKGLKSLQNFRVKKSTSIDEYEPISIKIREQSKESEDKNIRQMTQSKFFRPRNHTYHQKNLSNPIEEFTPTSYLTPQPEFTYKSFTDFIKSIPNQQKLLMNQKMDTKNSKTSTCESPRKTNILISAVPRNQLSKSKDTACLKTEKKTRLLNGQKSPSFLQKMVNPQNQQAMRKKEAIVISKKSPSHQATTQKCTLSKRIKQFKQVQPSKDISIHVSPSHFLPRTFPQKNKTSVPQAIQECSKLNQGFSQKHPNFTPSSPSHRQIPQFGSPDFSFLKGHPKYSKSPDLHRHYTGRINNSLEAALYII